MMNKIKKTIRANKVIVQNLSYLSVLQLFNMAVPLLTYPYLIRVLGKETYGLVIFAQALVGYLVILVNFGFNISATKEISVHRDDKNKISEIVSSVFILKGILFFVSLGILFVLLYLIPQAEGYRILFYLTMYLCLYDWLFPIWYFQGIERMKYITILNVISRTIFLVLIFVFIHNKDDFLWLPIIHGVGAIVASLIALYIIFFRQKISFMLPTSKVIFSYFKDAVPIFISNVSIQLYVRSNKVIIGTFLGLADVAYYDLAEKIANLLKTPQYILNQVLFPKISKEKDIGFVKGVFKITFWLNMALFLLVLIFIKPIIMLLGGAEMLPAIPVVVILAITIPLVTMSTVFTMQLLLPFGYNKLFGKIILSSAVFYVLSMLILWFTFGFTIENIALVTVLTEVFVLSVLYYYCVKKGLWIKSSVTG